MASPADCGFFAKDDCEEIVGVMTATHPGPHKPAGLQADNIALTRGSSRLHRANHIINSIIMSFENQNAPQAAVFARLERLFCSNFPTSLLSRTGAVLNKNIAIQGIEK